MISRKENYSITTDKNKLDIKFIHQFLTWSYWSENIPFETVKRSIDGSMCFGVFDSKKQIGFARMVTDHATFAYLADVFIDESWRGKGLSKWLMQVILEQPELKGMQRILLATRDAHGLYAQSG